METRDKFCWFDHISDDILLHILCFVPRTDWKHTTKVCARFRNVCQDKELFRKSVLSYAYGMSERDLEEYLRAGCRYIETLNLNHCYWFSSTTLAAFIPRCKKIQELFLLDCKLTARALTKILCSLECLKSIVFSVYNLLEFSNIINGNQDVQFALRHLKHFGLHVREESNGNKQNSLQFHLSQQTTVIEYCPNLESFCVIGTPGLSQKLSKRLVHTLIVKTEHLQNLKTMSINCTNDATSRLYFFGILVKAFDQPGIRFTNLSVSGLDLKQAVKRSYFIRSLKESCPTLENLDLSKVLIDELEASITIEDAPCLKHLNLADIRSESRCLGLLISASRCSNLVSLNLKGATSGCKYWGKEELEGLDLVLKNCRNLQHLNISGVHVHENGPDRTLMDVLTQHDITAFKSLALSVCCLVSRINEKGKTTKGFVSKGLGKRQRIARQPQPSTSTGEGSDIGSCCTELSRLHKACPRITSLELINTGFSQSVVLTSHKSVYDPCKVSHFLRENDITQVSCMTSLRYLQLTGLPGVSNGRFLKEIATNCVHLETLWLAYIGLGPQIQGMWDSLKFFKCLLDLRIEQPWMKLDEHFYQSCLGCDRLQRLVIVSKNSRFEPKPLENFVAKATRLYVIQLFTDTPLKDCDRYQTVLQKRYEGQRPGFHAVLEHLHHERVPGVLAALPLVHLDEITHLSSKVCSKPLLSLWGE
ncbi:F-box/LRR-repeat protein 18-like isoform X1 [Mercenaria mercenaria]|uniref:F-box/LRR-repeat protein 18-like isoform X1 n=1 Tax=Mercenaria mercenaria TaxID=6596 RepID=UPI00234F88FB|nr:F-box/LRR-repeat protein 18-like isoform X1 [Mercenaria mercenaria]